MLPILGPITPYRRVCGSIFIFLAVVLAPNVHFALKLTVSPRAAQWSIWGMLVLYLLVILVPGLQRVRYASSMVTLLAALVLASFAMACSKPLKQLIATGTGFYADALPWQSMPAPGPTWTYRNPFAGYSLQIPRSWEVTAGPIEGTAELKRVGDGEPGAAGLLRPTCDMLDEPLPVTVEQLLDESPTTRRHCGRWRGLDACLLERGGSPSSPGGVQW